MALGARSKFGAPMFEPEFTYEDLFVIDIWF